MIVLHRIIRTTTVALSPTASGSNDVPGENLIWPLSIVKTLVERTSPLIAGLLLDTVTDPIESNERVSLTSTSVSFARTSNNFVSFSPAEPVSGLAIGGSFRPLMVNVNVLCVLVMPSQTSNPKLAVQLSPSDKPLNLAKPSAVSVIVEPELV